MCSRRGSVEGMVTLRLHLDETPAENGALRVVPGSHGLGVLSADAALRCGGGMGR